MAIKFYRAKHDVSFPRVISRTGEGENLREETTGENYSAGSLVSEDHLTKFHKDKIASGELDHLLEEVPEEEAQQYENIGVRGGEPEFGVFIAEHEAEAHALEQYGHHVIPKEQELEALSSSVQHTADYQAAVKEAGLDRRPAQEAMAQSRDRVPDEMLYGAETRAGVPHNRGAAQRDDQEYDREDDDSSDEGGSESVATRPRPGVAAAEQTSAGGSEQSSDQAGQDAGQSEGSGQAQ